MLTIFNAERYRKSEWKRFINWIFGKDISTLSSLNDVPSDSKTYGVNNGSWTEIISGGALTEINLGTAIPVLGTIRNDSFSGNSLNLTYWTAIGAPNITVNNGITVNSGNSNFSKYIRFEKYCPYEKLNLELSFIPLDKNADSAIGFRSNSTMQQNNQDFFIKFDLNSGVLSYGFDTSVNAIGQALTFSIGNSLKLQLTRVHDIYEIIATNITSGQIVKMTIKGDLRQSGGRLCIAFLGGSQTISNFKISSDVKISPNVSFIGDSITNVNSQELERRYPNLAFNNDFNQFEVHAFGGICSGDVLGWIDQIADITPTHVFLLIGFNDVNNSYQTVTDYENNLLDIIDALQAVGTTVILSTLTPPYGVNTFGAKVNSVAATKGCKVVDLYAILKNPSSTAMKDDYYLDGVHPNDNGNLAMSNEIIRTCPELFQDIYSTGNSLIKYTSLPQGNENDNIVTVDNKGFFKKLGLRRYFDYAYIKNNPANVKQPGKIWIDRIKVNDPIQITGANKKGVAIGAPGGDNILIGSWVYNNTGLQGFDGITGVCNIFLYADSTQNTDPSISGNNNIWLGTFSTNNHSGNRNTIINCNAGAAGNYLTTGNYNLFIGHIAGTGISTGSNNIHILNGSDPNGGAWMNPSNSIIIGGYTNQNNRNALTGDIIMLAGFGVTPKFWWGGKADVTNGVYFNVAGGSSAENSGGTTFYFRGSSGTGTGTPGKMIFQTSIKEASGATYQDTYSDRFSIEELKVLIKNVPLFLDTIKSGATQGGASAAANEIWKTSGHATLPDNVLMMGV